MTTLEVTPSFIKTTSETNPFKINKSNVKKIEWYPTTSGNKLRIRHQNSQVYEFFGFLSSHFDELKSFFSEHYNIQIEKGDTSTKGYNWGELVVEDAMVAFRTAKDKKDSEDDEDNADDVANGTNGTNGTKSSEIFSFGLGDVRNCLSVKNQGELILEMYEDLEDASKFDESLVEVRFSFPMDKISQLSEIQEKIVKQADVISDIGESLVTFSNTPFAAPRGRYNVEIFEKFMRIRGKTYDFKILYRSINMMFLLDDIDGRHVFFVIYLGTPVRQGQKQHFHLVIHFDKTAVVEESKPIEIKLSQEEIDKRFPQQKIKTTMTGKLYEVAAKVFRAFTGKKLIGVGDFTTSDGSKGVKASMKANEGILFFLQKSLYFLYKPATYIRHDEVSQVGFQRAENKAFQGARFFDLVITYKNGKSITFTNIERKDEDVIMRYFSSRGIRVEGELQRQKEKDMAALEEDEESDEDFEAEESDDEADEADEADFDEFVGDGKQENDDEEEGEGEEDEDDDENVNGETESGEKRKREDEDNKQIKKAKTED